MRDQETLARLNVPKGREQEVNRTVAMAPLIQKHTILISAAVVIRGIFLTKLSSYWNYFGDSDLILLSEVHCQNLHAGYS